MQLQHSSFSFEKYTDDSELAQQDLDLLNIARQVIKHAYAPYSGFFVGAAAKLADGNIVTGTNQENASFPAGICAERVLLSAVSSIYPGVLIDTIAISYDNKKGLSDHPVSPCGICRQSLVEIEKKSGNNTRLILAGKTGEIYILNSAADLLPLMFSGDNLAS